MKMDLYNVMMIGVEMVLWCFNVFDDEVVPPSLKQIAPILRVATKIQNVRPRVAYLCRWYAFEKAHRLDPSSSGRGVRQFKIDILQRLERDNAPSLASRVKKTDAQEIYSFYNQYYKYVTAIENDERTNRIIKRVELKKAFQVVGVLFEVFCSVDGSREVLRKRGARV